eukprot:GHVR01109926.1.p1 GENE.GHVR01109926.1~~GHVR01109926.1.p1  ORF type:complete len:121 (+),score=21.88 GHVR01109926.1:511-873(+)
MNRTTVFLPCIRLYFIKNIQNIYNTTVNDVLLSIARLDRHTQWSKTCNKKKSIICYTRRSSTPTLARALLAVVMPRGPPIDPCQDTFRNCVCVCLWSRLYYYYIVTRVSSQTFLGHNCLF